MHSDRERSDCERPECPAHGTAAIICGCHDPELGAHTTPCSNRDADCPEVKTEAGSLHPASDNESKLTPTTALQDDLHDTAAGAFEAGRDYERPRATEAERARIGMAVATIPATELIGMSAGLWIPRDAVLAAVSEGED